MTQVVADSALRPVDAAALSAELHQIAAAAHCDGSDLRPFYIAGWEKAVGNALADGVLSEQEEQSLLGFAQAFGLGQDDLDANGAYAQLVKGAVIRDVLEGRIPERVSYDSLPFNMQKSEKLVWAFLDAQYIEQRTKTQYVGGSQGVSIRVAKGVYYRTNAFKGHPVQTPETVNFGQGVLGVTNKSLYFASPTKALRIPYAKVVSFVPYSDGIGVMRDAQSAKPQGFLTGDGWFTYNLVTNLASL